MNDDCAPSCAVCTNVGLWMTTLGTLVEVIKVCIPAAKLCLCNPAIGPKSDSPYQQGVHLGKRHKPRTTRILEQGRDRWAKDPFKLKEIWAIRVRLQLQHRVRELAMFDLVKMRVRDICHGERVSPRATVMQQKTSLRGSLVFS